MVFDDEDGGERVLVAVRHGDERKRYDEPVIYVQTPPFIFSMRLALFLCGALPSELGHYSGVFSAWLGKAYNKDAFVFDSYDVKTLQLPSDDDLDKYKAIVLTGSGAI